MTSLHNRFGVLIRARRQALGLSQEALADRAGLHRTYISLIERGLRGVSLETILKLAAALDATAPQLLHDLERQDDALPAGVNFKEVQELRGGLSAHRMLARSP